MNSIHKMENNILIFFDPQSGKSRKYLVYERRQKVVFKASLIKKSEYNKRGIKNICICFIKPYLTLIMAKLNFSFWMVFLPSFFGWDITGIYVSCEKIIIRDWSKVCNSDSWVLSNVMLLWKQYISPQLRQRNE